MAGKGPATIRGVVGLVRWSYYEAARIEGYTVSRARDGRWSLTATVVSADRFKMSQKPLMFVAPTERGAWTWPIRDLELKDGRQLTAQLGQPDQ